MGAGRPEVEGWGTRESEGKHPVVSLMQPLHENGPGSIETANLAIPPGCFKVCAGHNIDKKHANLCFTDASQMGRDLLMRVNSTNVLDEGLRIGEIGRRMNSKVNSVKQGGYESKQGCRTGLLSICPTPSPSGPYI
jgi:hypothetical protein